MQQLEHCNCIFVANIYTAIQPLYLKSEELCRSKDISPVTYIFEFSIITLTYFIVSVVCGNFQLGETYLKLKADWDSISSIVCIVIM